MMRPSVLRLFWLFARTSARRFCNRFLLGWQRGRERRRKKRGLPAPERTATGHRHQRFRAGTLVVVLFAAYMMFVMAMAVELSVRQAVNAVRMARQPAAEVTRERTQPPLDPPFAKPAGRVMNEATRPDPMQSMSQETKGTAERAVALLMVLAGIGALLFAIGAASRNLARPEPSLAWLFEFPVPRPVLFVTRLSESLFDGATLPLLAMTPGILLFYKGCGFLASVGWGLMFGALMALAVGALRIALEVLLLQKVTRKKRGTIGGLCAAAGTLLMVVVIYGGGTPALQRLLMAGADELPGFVFFNPLSGGFGGGTESLWMQWLTAAAPVALLCFFSVMLCARLTRYGLEPGLETARTSATGTVPAMDAPRRFSGLIGKELLMLTRQRTVMVQVMLAPAVMVCMFYFQSGGRLAERTLSSGGTLGAAIYGISSYMVLIAAQVAMNTELRTLWLLLSLPRPLADALRAKSRIWGAAAVVLATVLATGGIAMAPHMAGEVLLRLPFIAVLVWLIADLTVGIRTLGSCVISETTVQVRQWANWMPLLLSAGAGQAVYAGTVWPLIVQCVLLAALNVSIWQKLNEDLPYLTEPAEDPPARLCLMHGQFAVYGYFVLQSLLTVLGLIAKLPAGLVMASASALAAVFTAGVAVWSLKRRGVRILPPRRSWNGRSTAITAAALALACGAGFLWLKCAPLFPWAAAALEQSRALFQESSDPLLRSGLVVLAVIIAPLCEEFLFRGIVYQGLRRTCGVAQSVLWSALFFTVVHPPASAPAVLAAAVVLALVMERTRSLWPCVFVHAGYNAFILWLQWG